MTASTVTAAGARPDARATTTRPGRPRGSRVTLHVFLVGMALLWLFPVLWAVFSSFRDYAYTSEHGYVSFGGFTLDNYKDACSGSTSGTR
jgi:multiple sugar transport system permease protein